MSKEQAKEILLGALPPKGVVVIGDKIYVMGKDRLVVLIPEEEPKWYVRIWRRIW